MSSSPSLSSSTEAEARATVSEPFASMHDVACRVDVTLGSGSMTLRECLQLRRDSIVRLTQSAGADLQVIVNGLAIANGEVVIVEDSTAIRVTDILPPTSAETRP